MTASTIAGRRQDDDRARRRGARGASGQRAGQPEQRTGAPRSDGSGGDRDGASPDDLLRIIVLRRRASRNSNTSRLHVSSRSATAATSAVVANAPLSLSVSRIATGRPAASATYTSPRWTCADRGRVVVEQADEPELRDEVGDELLVPLAPQRRRRGRRRAASRG